MSVHITRVTSDADIYGILALQQANLKRNLSEVDIAEQGFVTLEHSFEVMRQMNDASPSIIAKDGDNVVGYALVMLPQFKEKVPALAGLFETVDQTIYKEKPLSAYKYVVVGQLCVGLGYRGIGLVDQLYQHYRKCLSGEFELCLTDISAKNARSRRVHQRVGFRVITEFFDKAAQETWELIVWEWLS